MNQKVLMTIAMAAALFCTTTMRADVLDASCSGASKEVDKEFTEGDPNHAAATLEKGYEWTVSTTAAGAVNIKVKFLDVKEGMEAPRLFLFRTGDKDDIAMDAWDIATQTATHTLTGKAAGENITFLVKVAYASGGVIFTKRITYTVGQDCAEAAVETVSESKAARCQKTIENGQLVIIRDGVRYNALGARIQ